MQKTCCLRQTKSVIPTAPSLLQSGGKRMPREVEPHNTALVPAADPVPGFPVVGGSTGPATLRGATRSRDASSPRRRARTRCSGFPFRGGARSSERARPPDASHDAVSVSFLRPRPKCIARTLPHTLAAVLAESAPGDARTRRRSHGMLDNRIASRRASPTLGRFGSFFILVPRERNQPARTAGYFGLSMAAGSCR